MAQGVESLRAITDIQLCAEKVRDDTVRVTFRNSVRTPGYNFIAHGNTHLMEDGPEVRLPQDFAYPEYPGKQSSLFSKFAVSPERPHPITIRIDPN